MPIKEINISSNLETIGYYIFPLPITKITYDSGNNNGGIGGGAFGTIYDCVAINGVVTSSPLVVKIFTGGQSSLEVKHSFETTKTLQHSINSYNQLAIQNGKRTTIQFSTFKGLPILSYEGRVGAEVKIGYLMLKFDGSFISFQDVLETNKSNSWIELLSLPMGEKLKLCLDLVETFSILHHQDVAFIHADLNPANFFVNLAKRELILIDYDSGASTTSSSSDPQTIGKVADGTWIAPEVVEQAQKLMGSKGLVRINYYSDLWSMAVAIHYLLVGFDPFYFLQVATATQIKNYQNAGDEWPNTRTNSTNFRKNQGKLSSYYSQYEGKLGKVPLEIYRLFKKTFHDGYFNSSRRPSLYKWESALKKHLSPPNILKFHSDKLAVLQNEEVEISWEIQNAHKVILQPLNIDITNYKKYKLTTLKDINLFLEVSNDIGIIEKSVDIWIKVNPLPTLNIKNRTFAGVKGLPVSVNWTGQNTAKILIKHSNGSLIEDIGSKSSYTFRNLSLQSNIFIIEAIGKFGGSRTEKIIINVFEAVILKCFQIKFNEHVHGQLIDLSFSLDNAKKATILNNTGNAYNALGKNYIQIIAENLSKVEKKISFILKVEGFGGDQTEARIDDVIIYPTPKIEQIKFTPDLKILYPEKLRISFTTTFVEEIKISYKRNYLTINPIDTVELDLIDTTRLQFISIGKLGVAGNTISRTIQVFHPIKIDFKADKRVTYPHIPVKLSWVVEHAQKVILQPLNVDITNLNEYEIYINKETELTLEAVNDKHDLSKKLKLSILDYPQVPEDIFVQIPKNLLQPLLTTVKETLINRQAFDYRKADSFLRNNLKYNFSKIGKFFSEKQDNIRRDFLKSLSKRYREIFRDIKGPKR